MRDLQVVPDVVLNISIADETAVSRLLVPTPPPTSKQAVKELKTEGARSLLAEKVEEEEDPEGPLHMLMASEDANAIAAEVLQLDFRV